MEVGYPKLERILLSLLFLWSLLPPPVVHCECSQFIALSGVSNKGNITSPGYPMNYPPDASCTYKLQGEAWQGVKIDFYLFDLEPPYSAGCLNDYLELNTVDTHGQRTFRGRFCGDQLPAPILVLHPVVELVFRSNHAAHHLGFVAAYEFVDEAEVKTPRLNATSPCGEVVSGIVAVITSPGFPRGYAAGLDCLWLIRVRYSHAIYLRIQHLEFQGSTANCQKAQLRIYDGYEHSLEDQAVLKKFCGDTRFYKGEEEKVLLSDRNRLLIRFTTTEPSKPVNDTETMVGFQLVWSDVEFNTPGNCSKGSRFACQEAQICFTHHHKGGTSSCPDLRHYCISSDLVCDGISHCGEIDSSDEQNCSKTPLVVTVIATPLAILTISLFVCFLCYKRNNRLREVRSGLKANHNHNHSQSRKDKTGSCCCTYCCLKPQKNQDLEEEKCHPTSFGSDAAPITRGPIYFKHDLESPGASDIVSPASGFSDTESEMGNQAPIFCPAHGPVHYVPLRYLSRHFPLLPVVQEVSHYPNDIYDEGGSIYSSQNSDNMIIYEDKGCISLPNHSNSNQIQSIQNMQMQMPMQMQSSENGSCEQATSTGLVNEWRLKQLRRVQRSDAFYMSDDNKSSVASSPGKVCPRCLEKERNPEGIKVGPNFLHKQNSGVQFDSGIDVVDSIMEPVKNVSFETCTSSDSAISQGFNHYRARFCNWKEKFVCPPPMVEEVTQTDPNPPNGENDSGGDDFCETVTTFGVNPDNYPQNVPSKAKATDV